MVENAATEEVSAGKSPRRVKRKRGKGDGGVHYLELWRGIHPLTWSFRAGDCESCRGSRRGLPSGTAELRRRIITFYADFNTRLRPIPTPLPSPSCRSHPPTPPLRDFKSVIRRDIVRSFIRFRTANSSFPLYVVLLFLSPIRTPGMRFLRKIDRMSGVDRDIGI